MLIPLSSQVSANILPVQCQINLNKLIGEVMRTTSNLQIRLDSNLRNEAQGVLNDLGMDVSTAVRIFLKQVVIERGLPFRPTLDPFYNPANVAHLKQAIEDVRSGRGIEHHALIGDDK